MESHRDRLRKRAENASVVLFMAAVAIVAALALTMFFFPGFYIREHNAVNALTKDGWSNIEVISSHWLSPSMFGGCSGDDDVAFFILGVNPAGKQSDATVCCNLWWKGCTVRH